MTKLSVHQKKVLDAFHRKNTDIDIVILFMRVYDYPATKQWPSVRSMQQKLAPSFAEINKKLKRGRVEPGQIKRTYRYSTGD